MARVTVEDCVDKVENRFELILVASHRARMISSGSKITVERDNDKNPVVALREIAETTVSPGDLKEDIIHSLQKYVEVDEAEPEEPLIGTSNASVDSGDTEVTSEHMAEEELLKGIEGLALVPRAEPQDELQEEDANLRYETKADIAIRQRHVRFWPLADIPIELTNVCFCGVKRTSRGREPSRSLEAGSQTLGLAQSNRVLGII